MSRRLRQGTDLRRHRRRTDSGHARRRRDVDEDRQVPRRSRHDVCEPGGRVEPDEGTVYATFDGHRSNDFKPYVLKSTDYGKTWTSIASNLPVSSVQVIREHPRAPSLLVRRQ